MSRFFEQHIEEALIDRQRRGMLLPEGERRLPGCAVHLLVVLIDEGAKALLEFREGEFGSGLGVAFHDVSANIAVERGP